MINVGREFEVDKTRWRSYAGDYFIAMATAAMPWFLIAIYYVFVLLPPEFWNSWEAWKENLLLSRFAAPTSAGFFSRCSPLSDLNQVGFIKRFRSWQFLMTSIPFC